MADYDGQTVTRCTYTVTNYPGRTGDVQVNLYLCGDVIVGGDIMALGENGFQASLLYPAENTPKHGRKGLCPFLPCFSIPRPA